jgi:hypothetical protein
MNPSSPVRLTTEAVDISMQATDHFFFELEVDGVFTSSHSKEFHPHLPHDRSFMTGTTWPNPEEHPRGVRPLASGEFNYTWTPSVDHKGAPKENTGTIRVGTGMGDN